MSHQNYHGYPRYPNHQNYHGPPRYPNQQHYPQFTAQGHASASDANHGAQGSHALRLSQPYATQSYLPSQQFPFNGLPSNTNFRTESGNLDSLAYASGVHQARQQDDTHPRMTDQSSQQFTYPKSIHPGYTSGGQPCLQTYDNPVLRNFPTPPDQVMHLGSLYTKSKLQNAAPQHPRAQNSRMGPRLTSNMQRAPAAARPAPGKGSGPSNGNFSMTQAPQAVATSLGYAWDNQQHMERGGWMSREQETVDREMHGRMAAQALYLYNQRQAEEARKAEEARRNGERKCAAQKGRKAEISRPAQKDLQPTKKSTSYAASSAVQETSNDLEKQFDVPLKQIKVVSDIEPRHGVLLDPQALKQKRPQAPQAAQTTTERSHGPAAQIPATNQPSHASHTPPATVTGVADKPNRRMPSSTQAWPQPHKKNRNTRQVDSSVYTPTAPTSYTSTPANGPGAFGDHVESSSSMYPRLGQPQNQSPYFVPGATSTTDPMPKAAFASSPQLPIKIGPIASGIQDTQRKSSKAALARKRDFSELVDLTKDSDNEEEEEEEQDGPPAKRGHLSSDIAPAWVPPRDPVSQPGPPEPSIAQSPNVTASKDMSVVEPLNRKYARRTATYDRKTIARDVLIATGRHTEMRPLNSHLDILKVNFKIDNSSDLSTLRWDLIDPSDARPQPEVVEIEDDKADDEVVALAPNDQPRRGPDTQTPRSAYTANAQNMSSSSVPVTPHPPMPKRRGRPPKSQAAGQAVHARATPSIGDRQRQYERGSASTSIQAATMASPGLGYAAFRHSMSVPDGKPLPRKKGRPVGWRKALHSKEARAKASGQSTSASAAGQINLPASQTPGVVVVIRSRSSSVARNGHAPTSYGIFKCQWTDCSAELHNLDTLRDHVFKRHVGQDESQSWACHWQGCTEKNGFPNLGTNSPKDFGDERKVKDHIEFAHLGPKSWALGDGPASGFPESRDSASDAYLSDSRTGRTVTPLVAPAPRIGTRMGDMAAATSDLGWYQFGTDVERDLAVRKKQIGPGLDRGGARLANNKRRLGFLDDDDDTQELVYDEK